MRAAGWLGVGMRVSFAALWVLVFVWLAGDALARAFLPVLRWVYELLDQDHRIVELVLSQKTALGNSDWVYRLRVVPDSVVLVGNTVLFGSPDRWAVVSVLVAYVWHPLLIATVVMAAFEGRSLRVWFARFFWLTPMLAMIAVMDLPWVLWAEVWESYVPLLPAGTVSPLLMWSDFLQRGGRFLLGALAGLIATKIAHAQAAA